MSRIERAAAVEKLYIPPELRFRKLTSLRAALEGLFIIVALRELSWQLATALSENCLDESATGDTGRGRIWHGAEYALSIRFYPLFCSKVQGASPDPSLAPQRRYSGKAWTLSLDPRLPLTPPAVHNVGPAARRLEPR